MNTWSKFSFEPLMELSGYQSVAHIRPVPSYHKNTSLSLSVSLTFTEYLLMTEEQVSPISVTHIHWVPSDDGNTSLSLSVSLTFTEYHLMTEAQVSPYQCHSHSQSTIWWRKHKFLPISVTHIHRVPSDDGSTSFSLSVSLIFAEYNLNHRNTSLPMSVTHMICRVQCYHGNKHKSLSISVTHICWVPSYERQCNFDIRYRLTKS